MRLIGKLVLPTGLLALGACAGDSAAPPTGASLGVSVAPLTLPGMTDACYGLTAFNVTDPAAFGAGTQVWTQPSLCASQYGADGGIRFTGICDAQAAGTDHANAVRLVLNDVYTGGTFDGGGTALTADTDYVNPCQAPTEGQPDNGCVLTAPCTENQDSKIVFNLTVMRNASLGFFDTIVKFQDLFCAAKLDCVEDDGTTTLDYLPIPGATPAADGPTAVLAFACTGGEGTADTYMYLDDVVVTCKDTDGNPTRTVTVDPSAGPGIVTPTQAAGAPILFSAAVNRGEGLNGAQYWNVLLGLNLPGVAGETCTVTTKGTASETPLTAGATPDHTRYPVVAWDVPLTVDGARACARHPLNNSGDDVQTVYTAVGTPELLGYQLARSTGEVVAMQPKLPIFRRHSLVDPVVGPVDFTTGDPWRLTPTAEGVFSQINGPASNPNSETRLYRFDGDTVIDICPNGFGFMDPDSFVDYDIMNDFMNTALESYKLPFWIQKDASGADLFAMNANRYSPAFVNAVGLLRYDAVAGCSYIPVPAGMTMAWNSDAYVRLADGRLLVQLWDMAYQAPVPAIWDGTTWIELVDLASTPSGVNASQVVTTTSRAYMVGQSNSYFPLHMLQGNTLTEVSYPHTDWDAPTLVKVGSDSIIIATSLMVARLEPNGSLTTLYTPDAGKFVAAYAARFDAARSRLIFSAGPSWSEQTWLSIDPAGSGPATALTELDPSHTMTAITPAGIVTRDMNDGTLTLHGPSGAAAVSDGSCTANQLIGPPRDATYYLYIQPSLVDGANSYWIAETSCGRRIVRIDSQGLQMLPVALKGGGNSETPNATRLAKWGKYIAYRSADTTIGLYDGVTEVTFNDIDADGNPSGMSDLPDGCTQIMDGPFLMPNGRIGFQCRGTTAEFYSYGI